MPSSSSSAAKPAACSKAVPFKPSRVPAGWSSQPLDAPGGGGTIGYAHFKGPDEGSWVGVVRGESPYALADTRSLTILGNPAEGAEIEDGFAVTFTACGSRFALLGYGLSVDDFFRLATSLAYSD
jgi:hypothetical protein